MNILTTPPFKAFTVDKICAWWQFQCQSAAKIHLWSSNLEELKEKVPQTSALEGIVQIQISDDCVACLNNVVISKCELNAKLELAGHTHWQRSTWKGRSNGIWTSAHLRPGGHTVPPFPDPCLIMQTDGLETEWIQCRLWALPLLWSPEALTHDTDGISRNVMWSATVFQMLFLN